MPLSHAIAQQISLILLILLYGTVLARLVPKKHHILLNVCIALVALLLGYGFDLSARDMGVSIYAIPQGILIASMASLAITITTLLIAITPPLRKFFLGDNLAHASGKLIIFETAIRIPLSTALIEEVLFRGVLLGLMLSYYPATTALVVSSIIFGLWHIFPTIATLEQNDVAVAIVGKRRRRKTIGIIGAVGVTSLAGLIFGILRLAAGSILAPWLVHWSINASGVLGIYVAKKITHYRIRKNSKIEPSTKEDGPS